MGTSQSVKAPLPSLDRKRGGAGMTSHKFYARAPTAPQDTTPTAPQDNRKQTT